MRSIAIIPARSGSKGLKDKNIKEFAGKPLLAHSIAAAAESGVFDEIMVSTDSEEYAEIAREWVVILRRSVFYSQHRHCALLRMFEMPVKSFRKCRQQWFLYVKQTILRFGIISCRKI